MSEHLARRCLFQSGKAARLRTPVFVLLALLAFASLAASPATGQQAAVTDATAFGRSVKLRGPWLSLASNDPRWMPPAIGQSQWTVLQAQKPLPSGFRGAPIIWYETTAQVSPKAPPVALYVERLYYNYAVFVNGVRIGQQGEIDPARANRFHPAEGFRIPSQVIEAAGGRLVIALEISGGPVGFLNLPPMDENTRIELVNPEEIPLRQSFRLAHDWSESFTLLAFNLLVGLCGLVIWWSLRDQWEYLALAVWLLCNAVTVVLNFAAHLRGAGPASVMGMLLVLCVAISDVAELEFMRLLLRRPRNTLWLALEVIAFLVEFYVPFLESGKLPLRLGAAIVFVRPLITEVFVGLALLRGALRGNRDAPLLLLPVALWSLSDIYYIVQRIVWFGFRVLWPELPHLHAFSYTVGFASMSDVLGLLSLVLIILRRTIRLSREKADLAGEVAAAEQLQLLLMARASRPTPGFRVETEYRPAGQVGGDFFLVSPCEDDNSLVAIVGDVSGKGLQAAMRVSMILGVLQREVMSQPDRVLHKLNTALLAQNEFGFTTACCVRVEADGRFCFANAGHLNPYLEGQELVAEGALPLGMDPEACYPLIKGQLTLGQRLVLFSDGVPEARDRKGELFGFERMREISGRNAVEIAEEAQRFGQDDDITVLALALV